MNKAKQPATEAQPWPASLYASQRVPVWQPPANESFVAEDIVEGCREAMQHLDIDSVTSLGITSSIRGEGRTTIALATAIVLAEYGLNVVLLELDLVHADLGQRLAVTKNPGLADLAEGRVKLNDVMRPVFKGLTLAPAGNIHGTAPHAIRQLATMDLLNTLESQGFVAVADLPPLLGNSVGHQAACLMAELVLVVRAGTVPAASIKQAVAGLPSAPMVLLNATRSRVPTWARRLSGV